ncbi:UNVERIFIED_CONTAM: hypothetical protein GTU68_002998 [Idotea baltica]|nr:hypothetical protein [Idotea baltica]
MDWFQAVVLALIQGVCEFLPISSSGHLILPSALFGWPDQGLAFDVAVHIGSLSAVVIYFRKDLKDIARGGAQAFKGRKTESGRLALMLIVATLPALVAGYFFEGFIEENFRSAKVIAYATIVGAFFLAMADRWNSQSKDVAQMTLWFALAIGLAQACALIPGTSRSGATITMALLIGFNRTCAARFSFLMSVPIILASGLWQSLSLMQAGDVPWGLIGLATVVSGVSAYLCIHYFLKFIERIGMMPFVIYRLLLGACLLVFAV